MRETRHAALAGHLGFILDHLQSESEYLDVVIECSLKMKDILHKIRRHASPTGKQPSPEIDFEGSTGDNSIRDPLSELNDLRENLLRQFLPVLEGRRRLASVRRELDPLLEGPTTVSMLAKITGEPSRTELTRIRREILDKINEVRAINVGNQAVLVYSINFYDRLLSGLTGADIDAPCYSASGEVTKTYAGNLLKTDC